MSKIVTLALPVFKRLDYLQHVLKIIESQDHPHVELIVSDNGQNGPGLRTLVESAYKKPFRFRQNTVSVSMGLHLNQILAEATGEYFVLLADDDEISSNFISELVSTLERHPEASVAMGRQEMIDAQGRVIRKSIDNLPAMLTGPDFIQTAWARYELRMECYATLMMRTRLAKERGGYPDFPRGNHIENVILVAVCHDHSVAFNSNCVFRWRVHEASSGWSASIEDFAIATRQFIKCLETDAIFRNFAATQGDVWASSMHCLVKMAWSTYLWRWRDIYADKMPALAWTKAGFALPWNPEYYRNVFSVLRSAAKRKIKRILGVTAPSNGSGRVFGQS